MLYGATLRGFCRVIEKYEAGEAKKRQGARTDIKAFVPEGFGQQAREKAAARDARFARVRDALAARGFDLIVTAGPLFIVSRWGRSRDLGDMGAVEAFARQVGVTA